MREVVATVEEVVAMPAYQQAALAYAGHTARHRPSPAGGLKNLQVSCTWAGMALLGFTLWHVYLYQPKRRSTARRLQREPTTTALKGEAAGR